MVYSKEKHGYIVILTTDTLHLLKASQLWQTPPTLLASLLLQVRFPNADTNMLVIYFSSLSQLGHRNMILGELCLWFMRKDFFSAKKSNV